MYSRLISVAVGAWILANPAAALSDSVTLQPKIFPFSSFSLITGMVFDGKSIWLATEYVPPKSSQTPDGLKNWGTRVMDVAAP